MQRLAEKPSASRQKFLTTSQDDGEIGGWGDGEIFTGQLFLPRCTSVETRGKQRLLGGTSQR